MLTYSVSESEVDPNSRVKQRTCGRDSKCEEGGCSSSKDDVGKIFMRLSAYSQSIAKQVVSSKNINERIVMRNPLLQARGIREVKEINRDGIVKSSKTKRKH